MLIRNALLFTLALVCSVSGSLYAQDNGKLVDTKSPQLIDYADVMPPTKSFQYWLDTISHDNEAFRKLLREEYESFHAVDDERVTKAAEYVAGLDALGLRKERVRRLEASFDYEAALDLYEINRAEGEKLSASERKHKKDAIIDTQLGATVRETYDKRNITAVKECGAPDYKKGEARILITLRNLVTDQDDSYVVFLKLYSKGLMWRWYTSKLLPYTDDAGNIITDPCAEFAAKEAPVVEEGADTMARLEGELKDLEGKLAAHQAEDLKRAEERAELHRKIREVQEARNEIARLQNPYGSPELTWQSAKRALDNEDWETFAASHSKRVRKAAEEDAEARSRFEKASKGKMVRQLEKSIVMDPDDPDRAYIKVTLQINSQLKDAWTEKDGEVKPDDIDRNRAEKRRFTIKLVREGGKWLIDNDL